MVPSSKQAPSTTKQTSTKVMAKAKHKTSLNEVAIFCLFGLLANVDRLPAANEPLLDIIQRFSVTKQTPQ